MLAKMKEETDALRASLQKDLEKPLRTAADLKVPELELPKIDLEKGKPAGSVQSGISLIREISTQDIRVQLIRFPKLNYSMIHCGIPLILKMIITNHAVAAAENVLVKIWLATGYGEQWQKTIARIDGVGTYAEENINVPLSKARLQETREAEKAMLRVDLEINNQVRFSDSSPIEVLAYNEWFYHRSMAHNLAAFVQPNDAAIEQIVALTAARLKKEGKDSMLSGYQVGGPEKVLEMTKAVYEVLQQDLNIDYINPPASFEQPEVYEDGTFSMSQKVFFPEYILKYGRGTCLDLALLYAACLERIGLNPVVFMIRGHAFLGVWLEQECFKYPALFDYDSVRAVIGSGHLVPINSTTFTLEPKKTFEECVADGIGHISVPKIFECVVDIATTRRAGIKPIPPLTGG
jgi:hypothetical protein